jgi:DNA-3-methyladenine glycosylase I
VLNNQLLPCRMLFELLVLSGAQVGSDWTSILKKREDFRWVLLFQLINKHYSLMRLTYTKIFISRKAFSGFDAETVATLTDKQMMSISSEHGIDISRVRGVVDNSNRILEVIKSIIYISF